MDEQVEFFKALADATRQEILGMLTDHEMNVSEICQAFEHMTQPTISHHLQILRNSGLVDTRREGKMIYYYMRRECMNDNCRTFFTKFRIRIIVTALRLTSVTVKITQLPTDKVHQRRDLADHMRLQPRRQLRRRGCLRRPSQDK